MRDLVWAGIVNAYTLTDSMARPGAFSANFAPDTLAAFRDCCSRQGKQYTKVLEQLAVVYLEGDGAMPVPASTKGKNSGTDPSISKALAELSQRLEQVEEEDKNGYEHLEALIDEQTKRIEHLEKAVQYRDKKNQKSD